MIRATIAFLALTVLALYWGGHQVYLGLRNRSPVEVTCADFEKQRPNAEWLRLTHCDADIVNAAFESTKYDKVDKVYVPLRPEGVEGGAAKLVVVTDDSEINDLADQLKSGGADKTVRRFAAAFEGPIEGTVQIGYDLSESDQSQLRGLGIGLDHDFAILERGAHPHGLIVGLGVLALGLLGPIWIIRRLLRRRATA